MTEAQEKKIDALNDSVMELRNAIIGNEKYKIKGIAEKVDDHEEKFKSYDTIKNKGIGIFFAFSFAGGILSERIVALVKYIFHG